MLAANPAVFYLSKTLTVLVVKVFKDVTDQHPETL